MKDIVIYGLDKKVHDTVKCEIMRKEPNPTAFARVMRVLRQNWRQGTVACKSRSEVAFSGRKPWRQKGTGRARVGSLRSPLWRKGGIIFGPQARVRKLLINDKERKLVFNNIFFSKLADDSIIGLDFCAAADKPDTKLAKKALEAVGLKTKKVLLFLPFDDVISIASFRNLSNVRVTSFDQPDAFNLTSGKFWVFLKKDVDLFKEMISQWN